VLEHVAACCECVYERQHTRVFLCAEAGCCSVVQRVAVCCSVLRVCTCAVALHKMFTRVCMCAVALFAHIGVYVCCSTVCVRECVCVLQHCALHVVAACWGMLPCVTKYIYVYIHMCINM